MFAFGEDSTKPSESQKKVQAGVLRFVQCALLSGDFRKVAKVYSDNNVQLSKKTEEKIEYFDAWARTKIVLTSSYCLVEIKTRDLDAIAASLPEMMMGADAKWSLKKVSGTGEVRPYYIGETIRNGRSFTVKVGQTPELDDSVLLAIIRK
jgi:hypothetical protein